MTVLGSLFPQVSLELLDINICEVSVHALLSLAAGSRYEKGRMMERRRREEREDRRKAAGKGPQSPRRSPARSPGFGASLPIPYVASPPKEKFCTRVSSASASGGRRAVPAKEAARARATAPVRV